MKLTLFYKQSDAIQRLLEQPRDIRPSVGKIKKLSEASPEHKELFDRYHGDIQTLNSVVHPWWEGTINALVSRTGVSREEATRLSYNNRAAGPASHPNCIWIIRNYWLDLDELNLSVSDSAVDPEIFLLQWLIDKADQDGIDLVSCLPYWPIGIDEDGDWI